MEQIAYILNEPLVKEGVKSVAGLITFVFGILELHGLYLIARRKKSFPVTYAHHPEWIQQAGKAILISAKISLILSATVSRPGVWLISSLLDLFFPQALIVQLFGPNTIFAVNPWHPRHVVSLIAVLLALPSIALALFVYFRRVYKSICHHNAEEGSGLKFRLVDAKTKCMLIFSITTSRPLLHIGNQLI